MLGDLALKASMTTERLNDIEGVQCNELMGAMYAFPRIFLPARAVADAKVYATSAYCKSDVVFFASMQNL